METHETRDLFPALPLGGAVLFSGMAEATRPVEDLTISEWSDRYRIVSSESGSPWPGQFRTERVPYLREPQDCLHPDHPARRVTARWAAQLGKSTAIENWFCYIVDQAPGSMMITLPTLEEATKFNRIKLQPTIDATPRVAHKVVPVNSRDEQSSTTFYKRFAGGFCQIVNAGSSKGLQMVSIKYLAMDEVTGYPKDVDGRGSPRDQARARQKMYGDLAKEWQGSTPGVAGECAVTSDFEAGDQRYFYVPCPHCGVFHALEFENFRPADHDLKLPVHFRCPSCDGVIVDGHKAELLAGAHWIARRVEEGASKVPAVIDSDDLHKWLCAPCEGRCRDWQPSYHLWAAYAPRERFADIWKRWEEAQGDTTKMRVFCQQDLAEPYEPGSTEINHEKIVEAARLDVFPSRSIPKDAALLVSAADIQTYGIKWACYAIGPNNQRWLIDREIFEGAPDKSDEPWIELADALGRRYAGAGGLERPIDLSGVDSGWSTQRVYRFCASRPNVYAIDGREKQAVAWLGTPTNQPIFDEYKRKIASVQLYPVNAYDIKTEIVAGLANLIEGTDATGHWPRNVLHLCGELCDETFAQELTAERLVDPEEEMRNAVNRRARNLISPKAKREWKKISGRKNDWFDVTVYAYALAWYLETKRRLTNERWKDLLLEVHGQPASEDLFSVSESDPFHKKSQQTLSLADLSKQLNG
ncbi:terminase gpA endonuclease subunit [uncultured Cohaesibacter sp.]|uniref:phage terminase large subunit family protein n=1 Tax=uncultured Cohaesibacter sp. TaxID=1002546 RepID=UPI0029C81D11|nr:terminase gpA endonuclease subunit [uncultured Cohaesibacter sp.]